VIWVIFLFSAIIIVLSGIKLAQYGDAIAYHTGLGGVLIGALLMAGATSLTEILTMINSIRQNHLNLTAGNLFGASMINMLILGILGVAFHKMRILRRVALNHALTASLVVLLLGLAVLFIMTDIGFNLGFIRGDGLILIIVYIGGVWLLRRNSAALPPGEEAAITNEAEAELPSLRRSIIGFAIIAVILVIVNPLLVRSASDIAVITGLGDSFIGILLISMVTSLPEMVTTVTASRVGAYDLAVSNLFGSSMFNGFTLGLADLIYVQGSFMTAIDPNLAIAGLLAMLLTTLALIGNLTKVEQRVAFVDLDALILILIYLGGLWLLYSRGISLG
jgi:cation:H+ antiporter